MSDKPKRTVAEIQQEYQGCCVKAGHCQYQLYTLEKDLEMINNTMRDLNLEAAASQAAEQEAKKAEVADAS